MTDRWRWFAPLWGLAVLWHLVNAEPLYRMFVHPRAASWVGLAIGLMAMWLIAQPTSTYALAGVCALAPVLAWYEAPRLGNHWLVITLVSVGFLCASITAAINTRSWNSFISCADDLFLPVARGVFFVFYTFTALSKVNRAFLDPVVSCGTYFADETAHSLGWRSLDTAGSPVWGSVVAVGVIAVELLVVLLLSLRRTRVLGVLLAVLFHGLIGLDGYHSFADFSALVYALVLLFLPADFFRAISTRLGQRAAAVGRAVTLVPAGLLIAVVVLQGTALTNGWTHALVDVRNGLWRVCSLGAALLVLWYSVNRQRAAVEQTERVRVVPAARWLLVIPALAVLNGMTPYVGVKTSYSWNMYSNLVTAPGYRNGLLIPAAWRWTERQADLVTITATSDTNLDVYRAQGYQLTLTALRAYTSTHRDASLTYIRGGIQVSVPSTAADPLLSRRVPAWEQRVFAYRAIDRERPARCQPYFFAAG